MRFLAAVLAACLIAALPGCGGDDEDAEPSTPSAAPYTQTEAPPPATTTAPESTEAERPEEKRERTPKSLADCIRDEDGVEEVLVKGGESEDAAFFGELVGGRVDVLGVTLAGVSGEVSVFLFASEADAAKAAPQAGGGGVEARATGSAVVAAPPGADAEPVSACLAATGYA
jgi:hypothetical protein